MSEHILQASQLSGGVWKYVLTEEGSAQFTLITSGIMHRKLVPLREHAIHAGTLIMMLDGSWWLIEPNSTSLDINGDAAMDVKALTHVLGCPPINSFPESDG